MQSLQKNLAIEYIKLFTHLIDPRWETTTKFIH